jgi:hypothetical protein
MNWTATLGALVTMCIVTLIGVLFWFRPIEEADQSAAMLVPPTLNLLIYALLSDTTQLGHSWFRAGSYCCRAAGQGSRRVGRKHGTYQTCTVI